MTRRSLAIAALLLASSLWGLSFIVTKRALLTITPEQLIVARFTLAGMILLPFALRRRGARGALLPGMTLGALFFAGYWLQTRGLVTTTASRSSFLTALGVAIVPLLEAAIYRVTISRWAITGSLLAVGGTALLFQPDGGRATIGDVLSVACALCFALHTVFASRYAVGVSAPWLALTQIAVVAFVGVPTLIGSVSWHPSRFALAAIVGLAALNTALAFFLLMWSQALLTATEAAIILAFEPVATALAAVMLGEERLTPLLLVGGAAIVAGMAVSQLRPSQGSPLHS